MTELQQLLDDAGDILGPGLFGLVTDNGAVVFEGSSGVADIEAPRPISQQDRFRIGSIAKVYVAVVVLQLISEDVLDGTDRLGDLLPDLVPGDEQITVETLLRMRSGLPHYPDTFYGSPPDFQVLQRYWSPEDLVQTALRAPGRTAPDTAYRYSSTDYVLLGLIVEKVTGRRVDAVLWERIFAPLQLNGTDFPTVDPHLRGPHATGYVRLGPDQSYLECTTVTPSESWAAGAIVSTPVDVATFFDALMTGKLLEPAEMQLMFDCGEVIDSRRSRGLGIVRYELGGTVAYGHQGGVAGFNATVMRTEGGRCAVLYRNCLDLAAPMPYDLPILATALRS